MTFLHCNETPLAFYIQNKAPDSRIFDSLTEQQPRYGTKFHLIFVVLHVIFYFQCITKILCTERIDCNGNKRFNRYSEFTKYMETKD